MRRALSMLLLSLLSLLPGLARADLSPMLYLCWARQAPEALELRVERIRTRPWPEDTRYLEDVATLKVQAVRRSASGVRVGDVIELEQVRSKVPPPRMPGPAVEPRFRRGQVLTAFLERAADGKGFYRAARGRSFDRELWRAEADPSKVAEPSC